jgi:lysozyme
VNPPNAPGPAFLKGIDVSHFQQAVDWAAVAAAGIQFCFIKATEGALHVDGRFSYNWRAALEAGLARGAYHFFHPAISVTAQADLFLRTVPRLDPGDLPPVLDLEAPEEWQGVPVLHRAQLVLSWLHAVEDRLHLTPILYLSPAFMSDVLRNATVLAQYPVWLAQYTNDPAPDVPKPWTKWTFWQHTRQGRMPGVLSQVDLNRFNGTLDELKALGRAPVPAASEISPA